MSEANPHQGYHAQLLEKLEGLYRENVTLRDTVTRLHLDCDLEARKAVAAERNNAALRNEIARLSNQTMWICSCGGTDCAGQKENAALRADRDRLDSGMIVLPVRGEPVCFVGTDLRSAIDAGIRKAQP